MKSFLEFNEGAVPAHMQGKQKPYVSSDGKGNFEVLGSKGQTKATFTRAEHGKDAQLKAQKHLKSKYDEYMKEEVEEELSSKQKKIAGLSHPKDKIDAGDLKKLRGEEVEIDETSDKAEMLRAALTRHSEKAMAANKAGNDDAVKVHQNYMNKIKDKMAKLARNEEVELDEEELDEGRMKDVETNRQEDERLAKMKKESLGKITIGEKQKVSMKEAKDDDVGEMVKDKLKIIVTRAQEMHDSLTNSNDIPEWVKSKVTLAQDYISTACDYACGPEKLGEEAIEEITIAGSPGWTKIKKDVKDKSGAIHTPMSRAKDLARQALKNVRAKKQVKGE